MKKFIIISTNQNGTYKNRFFLIDENYYDCFRSTTNYHGIEYGCLNDKNFLENQIENIRYGIPKRLSVLSENKINKAINLSYSKGFVEAIIFLFDLQEVSIQDILHNKFVDVNYEYPFYSYLSDEFEGTWNDDDYEEYDPSTAIDKDYKLKKSLNEIFIILCGFDFDAEYHLSFVGFNNLNDAKQYLDFYSNGCLGKYNHLYNDYKEINYGAGIELQALQDLVANGVKVTILDEEIYRGRDFW